MAPPRAASQNVAYSASELGLLLLLLLPLQLAVQVAEAATWRGEVVGWRVDLEVAWAGIISLGRRPGG